MWIGWRKIGEGTVVKNFLRRPPVRGMVRTMDLRCRPYVVKLVVAGLSFCPKAGCGI